MGVYVYGHGDGRLILALSIACLVGGLALLAGAVNWSDE